MFVEKDEDHLNHPAVTPTFPVWKKNILHWEMVLLNECGLIRVHMNEEMPRHHPSVHLGFGMSSKEFLFCPMKS